MFMDKNPCCCIPLRKGVLLIAIIDIVIGALGAGLGIFAIFAIAFAAPPTARPTTEITAPTKSNSSTSGEEKPSMTYIGLLLALFIVYCIFQIAFGGLLIWGLTKERVFLLKAWLGFRASGALFTLGTLVAFVVLGSEATIQPGLVDGVSLIFSVYCLLAVYIFATQLQPPSIKNLKPFNGHPPQV
ncbi:uncharacterized protein LOC110863033 [Folsomia candida]|uniref:Uncharacterized protein n=1 Tax=Folsomia candida TaxID=158441 RepID=A0A226F5L1_FOLCA|nr:uncharacterized protein LOC110863033 [Folsomia candida]OXA65079.1 hypothetical protein Fcan01_01506 [Folsomia candida]